MAGQVPTGNYAVTSSTLGSRRYHGSRPVAPSSGSYPDSDDYFLSTSSGMAYRSIPVSDGSFAGPMLSGLSGFDADFASEFLTEDAFSGDSCSDLTFVPSQYPGQGNSPDHLNTSYMPMDSLYMPTMMPSFNTDVSRLPTPPPEEYLQTCFPSGHIFQDQLCPMDKDFTISESATTCNMEPASPSQRIVRRPRPIRSASERNASVSEYCASSTSPPEVRSPPREDPSNREKARVHPYYNRGPDEDGKYHCPWTHEGNCNHQSTTQSKYVDSHLRPYRCKFTDRPECEDLRFSSNACLLRHEREAHGEHTHGMNPYLCKFPDCERAREGNGFPRRWNQRDHMKRVHQYEEIDAPAKKSPSSQSQSKRRKASSAPTSVPMRRSSSSTVSKAHAMVKASIQPTSYGPISRNQYVAPSAYSSHAQDYNAMRAQSVSMAEVQFSHQTVAVSRTSRVSPSYSGDYIPEV
ncbi:hypothetical protein CLCR_00265 [Cladophialophora carrionii]|uniref:C2H2 transcription factor n=1 Tax=Cladophialophora carrionii TaxID=86049 RepID=A0A1C1D0G2_9EURO|nr:hypothetical protein CLCR_00265 [Cladophialophora carrionii]